MEFLLFIFKKENDKYEQGVICEHLQKSGKIQEIVGNY